jgi:hypothetical protein
MYDSKRLPEEGFIYTLVIALGPFAGEPREVDARHGPGAHSRPMRGLQAPAKSLKRATKGLREKEKG